MLLNKLSAIFDCNNLQRINQWYLLFYLFNALYNNADLRKSLSCSITNIKSRKLTRFIFGRYTLILDLIKTIK